MEDRTDQTPEKKKVDDKTLAAFCHFSILLGIAIGPLVLLVPLIIWLLEKDKSDFVAFHAKQALFYQISAMVILGAAGILAVILMFILIGFLLMPLIFAAGIAAMIYGVVGGVKVLQGEDFRYYYIADKFVK